MKIIYKESPLATSMVLETEIEWRAIRNAVELEEVRFALVGVQMHLEHNEPEKVWRELQDVCESEDDDNFKRRLDRLTDAYVKALSDDVHCGDCTAVAASCIKCLAEEAVGVTVPYWGKGAGHRIQNAFAQDDVNTCAEAIEFLKANPSGEPEQWMSKDTKARWEASDRAAVDFLEGHLKRVLS